VNISISSSIAKDVVSGPSVARTDCDPEKGWPHATTDKLRIRTLGVPTYNRVDGLKESLASYLRNFAVHDRDCAVMIADDSSAQSTRQRCREMLCSLRENFGATIFYAGLEEKIRYLRLLIQGGSIPAEVVKCSLFDLESHGLGTYGANRNALLLHSFGEAMMCVDDDTFCRIVEHPDRRGTLSFHGPAALSSSFPCDVRVFANREDLLSQSTFSEHDFLGLHEEILGQDVLSLRSSWDRTGRGCLGEPVSDPGRVLVTLNGVAGDCAWPSPSYYLLLDSASLQRLVRTEESYKSALLSRQMYRMSADYALSKQSKNSPGLFVGLDTRTILPPYLPVCRGEDIIYWNTLIAVAPESYSAHLPWALLHLPFEERRFWPKEIVRSAAGVTLDLVTSTIIKSFAAPQAGSIASNMQALGRYLLEFASSREFAGRAAEEIGAEAAVFLRHLEMLEAQPFEGSSSWRRDLQYFIEKAKATISRDEVWIPLDLLYNRTPDEAREVARRLISRFGMLLCWWPAIIDRARELRKQGHWIGTRLGDQS